MPPDRSSGIRQRMAWAVRHALCGLAFAYVCLLAPALHAQTLPELPVIALEGFEPDIKEQIQKARDRVQTNPRDAEANGWLGLTLHAYDLYESALPCYERAHLLAPKELRWAYYLGMTQASLGKQREAATAFKAVLKLDADHLPAQLRLADALLADNQLSESQQFYELVLKRNANIAQAHYGLGRIAAANGKANEAVSRYRKALELFPEFGAAHYALGLALRDQGLTSEAQQHLSLSQQLKLSRPTLEDPLIMSLAEMNAGATKHLKRGVLLDGQGQLPAAIAEHEQALEVNPWLLQAHINLISLYGRANQPEKAQEHYRKVIGINPDLPESYYNYGVLLVGLQQNKEAEQAFQKCLQLNPYYAEAHHNYAVLIEREGRLDEAASHYRKAIENQPGYRLAHFHLGRILVNQDKLPEAIKHFEQTLQPEDSQTPLFTYALGATHIRAGNREKGIPYLREALKRATSLQQTQLAASIERDLKLLEQAK